MSLSHDTHYELNHKEKYLKDNNNYLLMKEGLLYPQTIKILPTMIYDDCCLPLNKTA